jgi:hypothetical protein
VAAYTPPDVGSLATAEEAEGEQAGVGALISMIAVFCTCVCVCISVSVCGQAEMTEPRAVYNRWETC